MAITARWLKMFGIRAMALVFIILLQRYSDRNNRVLMNHERIHLRQQWELLVVPFFILYIYEYVRNIWNGMTTTDAYRNISFEREAKANEKNLNYLSERKRNAWRKY